MCRKSNATCSHNLAILRQLVTVVRINPESRYVHYQQNHPKEYNVRQFRQCYVMFVCPPGGLATAGTGSKSQHLAGYPYLARAGQSLSSSRQECTESRQECTEPRHRITENPLRRVNSFGWMSSGWNVLSVDVLQASALGTEGYSVREINLHRNRPCCYAPSRVLLRA